MEETNNKPAVIRGKFSVKRKEYLTPHYIRVVLEGEALQEFAHVTIGMNNKIFIPGQDPDAPMIRRTYTLRALDLDAGEMWVDFVAHGDEGPASAWAINAVKGDMIEIAMKDKSTALYPAVDWYLLAGDHTALPVISVILETLPATAEGTAIIQVTGEEDILPLQTPSKVQIKWIYGEGHTDRMLEALANVILPANKSRYVFTAAEASVIKNLRTYFTETGIQREELAAYAYWKKGTAEGN